jgi:chromosome partitioning protein
MKVITLLAQKGGSGKSTAAINLAVAAEAAINRVGATGRSRRAAAIVDADPQASAAVWRFQRGAETPVVIAAGPGELGPSSRPAAAPVRPSPSSIPPRTPSGRQSRRPGRPISC